MTQVQRSLAHHQDQTPPLLQVDIGGPDDERHEPEQDEQGLISFTVVKEGKRTCIKVQAIAPSEMRVDINARWGGEPAMIGRQFGRRRFELEQDGYDLSEVGASSPAEPDSAMLAELGETDDFTYSAPHVSHEEIDFAEVYIKLDRDGDDIEMRIAAIR